MSPEYIGIIEIVDAILGGCLVLVILAIMTQAVLTQLWEKKQLQGADTLVDTLRTIALFDPDTIRHSCPRLISRANFKQIFILAKNIKSSFAPAQEAYLKSCFSHDQIDHIQRRARRSFRKWRRIEALLLLGYINAPGALPILKEGIASKDEDISYFSMLALGKIQTPESAAALLGFLPYHAFSGYKIVSILDKFPPWVVDETLKVLGHRDPFVRFWAIKLLIKFKPAVHADTIIQFTRDPSADVRAASCECLGELGNLQAKEALRACLEDEAWFVRMHAVRSLHKLLGSACLAEVIGLISDQSWLVKESVKQVMVEDIAASLSHVLTCLCGGDIESKRVCISALVDSGYVKILLSQLLSLDAQVKDRAIRLLGLLIGSRIHFGLKKTLETFEENEQRKILAVVYTIDKDLVGHIATR
jgi:uncharacterized membrane protein